MRSNKALAAALVAAGLAVTIVALDLAWNVSVSLDVRDGDGWSTVAVDDADGFYGRAEPWPGFDCVSGQLRVVVENGRPFGTTIDVLVTTINGTGVRDVLLDETWTLDAFSSRSAEFTVAPGTANTPDHPFRYVGEVIVEADDRYLSACREAAA